MGYALLVESLCRKRLGSASRMVKQSQTPAGTVRAPWGLGQGADRAHRALRLPALAVNSVAVNRVAFIRKLARTGFLTIWVGSRAKVRY